MKIEKKEERYEQTRTYTHVHKYLSILINHIDKQPGKHPFHPKLSLWKCGGVMEDVQFYMRMWFTKAGYCKSGSTYIVVVLHDEN